MVDLTDDETTVMLIAARGEPLIPIGRWAAPVKNMVARGYLRALKSAGDPTGHFNNVITAMGRKVVEEAERDHDKALGDILNMSAAIGHHQTKARAQAEYIAVQLVDLAELSSQVTGDSRRDALEKWSRLILQRALEKIG
jgi:hypothetical protein